MSILAQKLGLVVLSYCPFPFISGERTARSVNCEFDKDFCGWTVVEPELNKQKEDGVYISEGIIKKRML